VSDLIALPIGQELRLSVRKSLPNKKICFPAVAFRRQIL
jgi:hypothetical protein